MRIKKLAGSGSGQKVTGKPLRNERDVPVAHDAGSLR
jgi:hypothetical protein